MQNDADTRYWQILEEVLEKEKIYFNFQLMTSLISVTFFYKGPYKSTKK